MKLTKTNQALLQVQLVVEPQLKQGHCAAGAEPSETNR